jgi:hypothetical protein
MYNTITSNQIGMWTRDQEIRILFNFRCKQTLFNKTWNG